MYFVLMKVNKIYCKINKIWINSLFVVVYLLIILPFSSKAQLYKPHPLLSPMWQADADYYLPSETADTLKNGFASAAFQFRVPLYIGKDWLSADGGKAFFAALMQAGTSVRQTQGSFFDPDKTLTNTRISFSGMMANGPSSLRNLYFVQLATALPSEDYAFKVNYLQFSGTAVWRHLYHNNKLWHTLGLTYTPIFGRNLLLPVAGIGYKINKENQVQFTFPFNLAYTHEFARNFNLSVRLNNNGGYYHLQNNEPNSDADVIYRQRYRKLSLVARYYTTRHVVLTPEIGLTGKSKIEIDEAVINQVTSLYFRFTMQVRFGKRPAASPILNFDPGDSGFDPGYLSE